MIFVSVYINGCDKESKYNLIIKYLFTPTTYFADILQVYMTFLNKVRDYPTFHLILRTTFKGQMNFDIKISLDRL